MVQAKVILKGAKTYIVNGRRFIKDVPVLISDADRVKEFQANGHFSVTLLKAKVKAEEAEKKAKSKVDDDEDEEEVAAPKKKSILKK